MHTWFLPYSINKSIQEGYSCLSQTHALCQNTFFTHVLSSLLMAGYKSLRRKNTSRHRLCSCKQEPIRSLMQVWRLAHHNFFLTVLLFQLPESPDLFSAMGLLVIFWEVTIGSCHLSHEAPSSLSHSQCQCFPYQSGLLFQCSSLPPSWQTVNSSAAATAKSDSWRCDSTVKIFQHCCSEKLQWQEVTVKNSIMYLEALFTPHWTQSWRVPLCLLVPICITWASCISAASKLTCCILTCQAGTAIKLWRSLTVIGTTHDWEAAWSGNGLAVWACHLGPVHIANLAHKAVGPRKRARAVQLGGLCESGGSTSVAQLPSLCLPMASSQLI